MGILGRIKGLSHTNSFHPTGTALPSSFLETSSTWCPRPNKVLRSYYHMHIHSH